MADSRPDLVRLQHERLSALLATILPHNPFYARKLAGCDLTTFHQLPFTAKAELLADQAQFPPYGTDLTYPLTRYSRFHQTSGTSAQPLRWLATAESWAWALDNWGAMYRLAGCAAGDRVFLSVSL